MSEQRYFAHPLQVAVVAVAAFAIECFILRVWLLPGTPSWIPLGAHLSLVGALCGWFCHSPGLRADVRLPLLLIAGTAALGPAGPAGALVTMALTRWYMRNATTFDEWYRALFPETRQEAVDEFAAFVARSDLDNPDSLTPFAEALTFGSLQQKQALIALINRSFRPAFGPILKRALTDPSNAIRVQAATAMNRIERGMHELTLELSNQVSEHPGDPDALRALAQHYDRYLYSRILDVRREEELRERALDAYRRCAVAQPDDPESQIAISRLLLRGGRYAEAAGLLEKAMNTGGATSQAELWYMESLYNLGRFAELREYAGPRLHGLDGAEGLAPAALEAVHLWAGALRP
jgi:tetratricopeptide (TPR) repeat protein